MMEVRTLTQLIGDVVGTPDTGVGFEPTNRIPGTSVQGAIEHVDGALTSLYVRQALLAGRARNSKGGVVGTAGLPAVALRTDDGSLVLKEWLADEFYARGLPWSGVMVERYWDHSSGDLSVTVDDVHAMRERGMELWNHGYDHKDGSNRGYDWFLDEFVNSKAAWEDRGFKVQGFAKPGITPVYNDPAYGVHWTTDPADFDSDIGRLLLENYALTETYAFGPHRPLPSTLLHGWGHLTVSDGRSFAQNMDSLDDMAEQGRGYGLRFMIHPHNIDGPGNMTTAEFLTWLDHLAALRDAGQLEVLTSSGLNFADPNTDYRFSPVTSPGWEGIDTGDTDLWDAPWNSKTIVEDGGERFLRCPDTSWLYRRMRRWSDMEMDGETFQVKVKVRGGAGQIALRDNLNPSAYEWTHAFDASADWQTVRFCTTLNVGIETLRLGLRRTSGDPVDFARVDVLKV